MMQVCSSTGFGDSSRWLFETKWRHPAWNGRPARNALLQRLTRIPPRLLDAL